MDAYFDTRRIFDRVNNDLAKYIEGSCRGECSAKIRGLLHERTNALIARGRGESGKSVLSG